MIVPGNSDVSRARAAVAIVAMVGVIGATLTTRGSLAACNGADAKSSVSFQKAIQPIFEEACMLCHIGGDAPENLVLSQGLSYRYLVNFRSQELRQMLRVDPGSPETSYIVHKLRGTHMEIGGDGARMPVGRDPLTEEEIRLLVDWIRDCSPDN